MLRCFQKNRRSAKARGLGQLLHLRSNRISAIVTILFSLALPGVVFAEDSIASLADRISESHERLMHVESGVRISYEMKVFQPKEESHFSWGDGSKGELILKWPNISTRLEGPFGMAGERHVREGEFNFDNGLGAGRDHLFVQATPYRHSWSAITAFPLRLLFVEQADQKYVRGQTEKTGYWLPAALRIHEYHIARTEPINGVNCTVVEREDGTDRLWIGDESINFLVCRRQIFDKRTKLLLEQVSNTAFAQVQEGIWLPSQQTSEVYNYSFPRTRRTKEFTYKFVLTNSFSTKDVEIRHVEVPNNAQVDDQIRGINYARAKPSEEAFRFPLKQAIRDITVPPENVRKPGDEAGFSRAVLAILLLVNLVLFAVRRITSKN